MIAPTAQITDEPLDAVAELQRDLADHNTSAVERRIARAERRIARAERNLADPHHRAAAYRRLVMASDLPSNVARLLCCLTETFGARLENCFAGRKKMQAQLGIWTRQHSMHQLTKWLTVAVKAGWVTRLPLTTEDGGLVEAGSDGRFISATGIVFNVPAGVIAPGHPGIPGPRVWSRRIWAKRRSA